MRVLKPDTEADVLDAVREAARNASPLAIEGNGTKRALGRKVDTPATLRLAGLSGITMYEPDEMVFTARAGTTLAEIESVLEPHGQCLGFEPGDIAGLWGGTPGNATIGGTIAAGISGPRRFAAGAARDHLLGFTGVNGKGERFKAGGRVVKNVTGYDLPKLAAGSFGTLAVMTELTLRALPRGSASTVLGVEEKSADAALKLLREVAGSPFDPSGLGYLPSKSLALIRLEGSADGVAARVQELKRSLAPGAVEQDGDAFESLRTFADFNGAKTLWRLVIPPANAAKALATINPKSWAADWAGGVLWLETETNLHRIARQLEGHATLFKGGGDDIFTPLDAATAALTQRIKTSFDPARILNPGRMHKDL